MSLSTRPEPARSFNCSAMPLPLINQFLSRDCHWKWLERVLQIPRWEAAMKQRRKCHEDLSAVDADRCPFRGDSLHVPTRTAVGIASAVSGHGSASGKTALPSRIFLTSFLGMCDSSLSTRPDSNRVGARP